MKRKRQEMEEADESNALMARIDQDVLKKQLSTLVPEPVPMQLE